MRLAGGALRRASMRIFWARRGPPRGNGAAENVRRRQPKIGILGQIRGAKMTATQWPPFSPRLNVLLSKSGQNVAAETVPPWPQDRRRLGHERVELAAAVAHHRERAEARPIGDATGSPKFAKDR